MSGHHQNYLKETIRQSKEKLILICPSELSYLKSAENVDEFHGVEKLVKRASLFRKIEEIKCRKPKVDAVIAMCADHILKYLWKGIFSRRRFEIKGLPVGGIWFRSNFYYKDDTINKIKRILCIKLLTQWSKCSDNLVFLDDCLAIEISQKNGKKERDIWLKEPYTPKILAEIEDKFSNPLKILFAGCHEKRKGTTWALEAIAASRIACEVTIIGEIRDETLKPAVGNCRRKGINVKLIEGYVSNESYVREFQNTDIVALPYQNFGGSSGVLLEAAQYQKPVIATNFGSIGRIVNQTGSGLTFSPLSMPSFIDTLERMKESIPENFKYLEVFDRCSSSSLETLTK